ncbi:MAG: hormogonium polysaccharide biosynthesis protein HpsL [Geitlerinemataceae cyanobacterium]
MPKSKEKPIDFKKLGITLKDIELEDKRTSKEIAAEEKSRKKEIVQFVTTMGLGISVGIVIGVVLFFVKDEKLAIAGGGGVVALLMALKYPYLAIWAFAIYMPFAGTVTYWVGGGNAVFQLAKDGLAYPAYLAVYQSLKKQRLPFLMPANALKPFMILAACIALTMLSQNLAQQFSSDPKGKPIAMGVIGIKVLIGYLPLITCTYYLLKTKTELLWFTRLHTLLAIACCLLGVLQYQMLSSGACQGTDHLAGDDLFKATLEYKCLVGGSLVFSPSQNMIRLPGTFVAPWQWAWFLIGNAFTTFATTFSDASIKWRAVGFIGLALVFVNSMISGQRIALLLVPVIVIALLILTGQLAKPKTFIPIVGGMSVLIVGAFILFPDVIQGRIDSTISRWQASPPTAFIAEQAEHSTGGFQPFGHGVGRATNSARVFGEAALIETYYPKLMYEIGLGTLAFLGLVTAITVTTFKAYRSLKDKDLRSYGASFWVFVFFISYQTYYYPLDVDPVAVYYWMFAGLLLRLPEIDRQESEKKHQALQRLRELLASGQLRRYLKEKEKKKKR